MDEAFIEEDCTEDEVSYWRKDFQIMRVAKNNIKNTNFDWFKRPSNLDTRSKVELIKSVVCLFFDVEKTDIDAKERCCKKIALSRQVFMSLCSIVLDVRPTHLSEIVGRDRTTIIHAGKVIEQMRDDVEFDDFISDLEERIQMVFSDQGF